MFLNEWWKIKPAPAQRPARAGASSVFVRQIDDIVGEPERDFVEQKVGEGGILPEHDIRRANRFRQISG